MEFQNVYHENIAMENPEEYILRVLRRTHLGLQDSLFPAHAEKLASLVVKLDQTESLFKEIQKVKLISGFAKCALSIEWLYKRVQTLDKEQTPEQFESDVLFLNEKIFEAFLNQPFESPEAVEQRSFQSDESLSSQDPFGQNVGSTPGLTDDVLQSSYPDFSAQQSPFAEPDWNTSTSSTSLGSSTLSNSPSSGDALPSLRDALSADLLDSVNRIAEMCSEFITKLPNERLVTMAVVRMTSKTATDNARNEGNLLAQDFFLALTNLVNIIDKEGKIKMEATAMLMMDLGDRIKNAVNSEVSGMQLLKKITEYIHDPKELLKSLN